MKPGLQVSRFKFQEKGFTQHHFCGLYKSGAGFTLLESLIAIAIFTVGISAALSVIVSSLNVGARAKNQIIASNLAEEGIEVVRNIRDRNWMAGNPWYANIDNTGGAGTPTGGVSNACVQWDSAALDQTAGAGCTGPLPGHKLVFEGTHYTAQSDATASDFSRTIDIDYCDPTVAGLNGVCDPARLHVTSTVMCGGGCQVSADEYLYDWK